MIIKTSHGEHPEQLRGLLVLPPTLQDFYSTRLIVGDHNHPLLQSATIREEAVDSPGQDQLTEGQLHPPGHQEVRNLS